MLSKKIDKLPQQIGSGLDRTLRPADSSRRQRKHEKIQKTNTLSNLPQPLTHPEDPFSNSLAETRGQ